MSIEEHFPSELFSLCKICRYLNIICDYTNLNTN
jgi:hypothetical protein